MVHGPSRLRVALLAAAPAYSLSLSSPSSAADLAKVEQALWRCDQMATTNGSGATPFELCGAVYEELKSKMFGGDFALLLACWSEHKAAEHERRSHGRPP
jgi:hypothetical protein